MNKEIVNTMSVMKNICFSIYSYTKVIKIKKHRNSREN